MRDPIVSIIVISFNTRDITLECLHALFANLGEVAAEVLVIDNGSQDESVAAIRRDCPQVRVITNDRNAGFAAANNRAMEIARGKFMLLLNSDAFIERGAVCALIDYLEKHARVGAVGPRLLNSDGSLQISCFPFPSPLRAWVENLWLARLLPHTSRLGDYRKWAHDRERLVDWVVGACILVRREAYEAVGGFDERVFMYSEEADWQRRMRDQGWEIGFTPAARVKHLGGASGAGNPASMNQHFFQSLDRYELKHHGWRGLFWLRMAMAVGSSMRAIVWAVVWLVQPRRRSQASCKIKLHSWLVARQLTHWRTFGPAAGGPGQWGIA
jgi:N-acetylglucosaminyl-diphospho-decaprenol L-rhamnosyltransferase